MHVVIGVDPHKASHTAVAIGEDEVELATLKLRSTSRQIDHLLEWAAPFEERRWAVESATGLGYLLSQQLIAKGEAVVDVPPTLSSRVRVLDKGKSNKNDRNDARSVAVAALRTQRLRVVTPANHSEVLRILAKRNIEIGNLRNRIVCRLHSLTLELVPGGIAGEMKASDVDQLLRRLRPRNPVQRVRIEVAGELLEELRRLDAQLNVSHRRIRDAIAASGTSLTDIYGIGPIIAAEILGFTGDIRRFKNRDAYAAYNGTAPVEFSSGGRTVHRVSRRGNRMLNHAMHMAAICQIRQNDSEGRRYYDRRVAEGKTKREAIRSLKRQVSNTVYRQLLLDAK